MALEDLTGTKYIDDLNSSNPAAGDNVSEGDDHIRGIKNVLKTTFPNIDGAVNATDTDLSNVLPTTGGTMTGTIASFTSTGIDDNANATAITIDSNETTELKCQAGDGNVGAKIYHPTSTAARHIVKFQSNVGGTQTDKAVIDCSGNVGIGTDSPNKELHLLNSSINKPMIKIESTGTNSYPGFQIKNDSQTWEVSTHGGHSDALTFYNGSAHTLALATSGNVGIGDTDPSEAKLSITGVAAGDYGLKIDQDQDASALYIDCEATGENAISVFGKYGLWAQQDISGGYAANFYRNLGEAGSCPLVTINDTHVSNTQPALKIIQDGAGYGLEIDQNGNARALKIDCASTSYDAIKVHESKYGMQITQTLADGYAANFNRNIDEAGSNPLVKIIDDHTSNTQPALKILQDGTGVGLEINQNGNGRALFIDSEATTQPCIHIDDPANTTGNVLQINSADDLTTGYLAYLRSNATTTDTRNLVYICNDHPDATGTTALYVKQDSTGLCADFVGDKIRVADGILFGTDTVDANALDDYEEGGFTPVYALDTPGDSSWTQDRQVGKYTKIGRQVFFQFFIRSDAYSNSTGSGRPQITGLPFVSSSDSYSYRSVCIRASDFAANNNPIMAYINAGTSLVELNKRADVNDDSEVLDENSCADGTNKNSVYAFGSYYVD